MKQSTEISPCTNGGKHTIELSNPYIVDVTIEGVSDILFHRWNCEAVAAKSAAAKGSKAKKTDDVESFVYRDDKGTICLPGAYLRASILMAAKFRQDPRSPRKSAMDLFKAAIIAITPLAPLGKDKWDYEHQCRMVVQRSAITRTFPAFKAGWRATIQLQCNLPEYVSPQALHETIVNAGRLIGVGDLRPTYGRFGVVAYDLAILK